MGISCLLYDQLEIAAMRNQKIRLQFNYQETGDAEVVAKIENLFVKNGEEFVTTREGQTFPLRALTSLEVIE